ncbi:D-alanyl-D-alanine carboxypeptidase [Streptomyces fungicidicus]|uniref:D-alanyl-D-alanine carboxypeptidase n=1 Tax=Streptomyces fungicidicus TaxID=68203 RepID=UPI0037FA1F42
MAGESPDRSKQRESSAEPTSGSAGPVPEKRDPRLAVAREAAGPSEKRDRVDTATRVLSTRDGRLREAVASWVRSAEPEETPHASAASGEDTGTPSAPEAPDGAAGTGDGTTPAAPTDGGTPAGATETGTPASEAPRTPEKPAETARDASPGDGDAEDRAPADTAQSATDAGAAGASEDEPSATTDADTPANNAPRAPETAAGDATDASDDEKPAGTTGTGTPAGKAPRAPETAAADAEDRAPGDTAESAAADAKSTTDTDTGTPAAPESPDVTGGPTGDEPAGTAETGTPASEAPRAPEKPEETAADASDADADDAAEHAKGATNADADATDASTDPEDAEDGKPAATAGTGTPASGASRTPGKPAEAATDDEGREPAAADTDATDASEDAEGDAPAASSGRASRDEDAEDEAPGGTGRSAAGSARPDGPEAAARTASGGDSEDDEPDGTAKRDEGGSGGSAPKSGGGDPDGGGRPKAKGPVDQPTAVFRTGRASAPAVDQPTTMLKLGDVGRREAEAERTSRFVALKRDEDLGGGKPPAAPAGPTGPTTALPQVGPERTTQQPLPPKPPLDLLAELTNTPPPPQTPLRTAVRRVKIWTPLVLLLVIVFAVVQNFRPLPTPTLVLTAEDSYTFEGGKPEIPWPAKGQAALDVDGIGTFGSSGEQKPVPIASVAKVMTAYLILRDHPLKSGADGPMIDVDQTAEKQSSAGDESTVHVTAGDKISQREALEAILIASANNVARLVARWDAGSEKAFVEKMNEAAKDLGMTNTTYTDPSGLNNTTVSTAVDQVKLAKAAMEQPAFREVAAMMEYIDYKGVKHGNWNQLVGHNDVVGIKTGTTTSALGNLSFAAKKDVDGETRRIIGAVVRQPEGGADNTILAGALSAGDQLIRAAQGALESATILKKGTVVGYADDGLGGRTPVAVTEDVKAVGWAGLSVKLTFAGDELPHTAKAGTEVGTLTVGDGSNGAVKVPVALQEDLVEPGFTDKLTRIA